VQILYYSLLLNDREFIFNTLETLCKSIRKMHENREIKTLGQQGPYKGGKRRLERLPWRHGTYSTVPTTTVIVGTAERNGGDWSAVATVGSPVVGTVERTLRRNYQAAFAHLRALHGLGCCVREWSFSERDELVHGDRKSKTEKQKFPVIFPVLRESDRHKGGGNVRGLPW
jgi:hypothetical protein